MLGQRGTVIFLLGACRSQSDGAPGDGVFCLAGYSLRGCGVGLRLVLIDNGQIVGILAVGAIGFDFHVRGSLELGILRTPRTSRCSCGDGIGVFFVIRILDLDDNINECVLAFVFAGHKLVCLGCNIRKHIDAFAVIDLGGSCTGDARLGNLDGDGRVIDLDDFFALFILDAGTGVGGLGAAVVVVVDGEFDDELAAVWPIVLIEATPFIREIKAGNCDRTVLMLGRYSCGRSGGSCKRSALLELCNLQRDILRALWDSKVAGNVIDDGRGAIEFGGVRADFFADGVKDIVQRICVGSCKVEVAFASCATIVQSHRRRIVRRREVHIAVCCYALILQVVLNRGRRVCPIENTNGINLGIVIFASLCVIDGIIRHSSIEVIRICRCRIAIREHDDYTLAIFTSLNRILGKNLICHVKPVLGIGIATCGKAVNGRIKFILVRFCTDQRISIIDIVCGAIVHHIFGRK